MATTKTTTKEVLGVYGPGSNHFVGDGFPVRLFDFRVAGVIGTGQLADDAN